MSRTQPAPGPAELLHLRPSDATGVRVIAIALAGTLAAVVMSVRGGWLLWAAGQALLALLLVQWFVILHECGHCTMFRTRRWHGVAGRVAALLSFIPYSAWTRVHGRHHKWTGWQDLDPTTAALVPRERSRVERAIVNVCWRLWIPLFSIVYRLANYWNLPRLWRMFPGRSDRLDIARDTAAMLVLYATLVLALGPATLLRIAGAAIVLSLIVEDLLLLSQHTHLPQHVSHGADVKPFPSIEQEPFTRSLRLPRPASAFLLHFDAHELHHMYPFVPGYQLGRIPYAPAHEVGWWQWTLGARKMPADVLLFQNRLDTGYDL